MKDDYNKNEFLPVNRGSFKSEYLPLIIKKYDGKNAFSQYIHECDNEIFKIEGPMGYGFQFDENTKGLHVFIAAGTGILPYLDFFDYLLKKTQYEIVKAHHDKETAQLLNPDQEDYEKFLSDFQLILVAAFENTEEFLGMSIINKLYDLNQQYKLEMFNGIIRLKVPDNTGQLLIPTTQQFFDLQFQENLLNQYKTIEQIHMCCPPNMQNALIKNFKILKFDINRISLC